MICPAQVTILAILLPARAFLHLPMLRNHCAASSTMRSISMEGSALFISSENAGRADANRGDDEHDAERVDPGKDTIRVRIWRALASGDEITMTELSNRVGERNRGNLRSHLVHVERQAKTIGNKSSEWRERRGLPPLAKTGESGGPGGGPKRLRLKMRRGAKNEVFIRLL
mmetsp:Transcript_29313/g.62234  ORF Transcript_29313/g.62234 Transcript_29313/m.62234 type:complete len:171 (+) Transcript_29313:128-640(+)